MSRLIVLGEHHIGLAWLGIMYAAAALSATAATSSTASASAETSDSLYASSAVADALSGGTGQGSAAQGGGIDEIVVTARKRSESIMRAPVDVEAVTSQQVEDRKIIDIQSLATATPGMLVQEGFGGVGSVVFLRGIGNGSSSIFIDQSVALNVDGATLSQGTFYRVGMFDVDHIEVLKGPQSLFFGKSTDAGVISVQSADPTPTWTSKATVAYEFNAQEKIAEAFVAGPLTDSIGIRVAGYFSDMDGWLKQANPDDTRRNLPDEKTYGGRLTLVYNNDDVRIKLKATQFHSDQNDWIGDMEQRQCYGATAQKPNFPYDNCRLDDYNSGSLVGLPYLGLPQSAFFLGSPAFATSSPNPLFRSGIPYELTDGTNVLLNGEFQVAPKVSLTSVSSYTRAANQTAGRTAGAYLDEFFDLANLMETEELSQELRLTSNYDGPFDFMFGAFYDQGKIYNAQVFSIPSFTLFDVSGDTMRTQTLSGFGQLLYRPVEPVEISAGVRYTEDKKWMSQLDAFGDANPAYAPPGGNQLPYIPSDLTHTGAKAWTPELTLTYHPSQEITTFASYKKGFKGTGFNVNTTAGYLYAPNAPTAPIDLRNNGINPFGPEKVQGGEAGLKASLDDRHLNLTATVYSYLYTNQQVSFTNSETNVADVVNGDDLRNRGVELGLNYLVPQIDGLAVNAFANYNDAVYTRFPIADCYSGQDAALGCSGPPNILTGVGAQNLTGKRPYKSPLWTGTVGGEYSHGVGADYALTLTSNVNFSSGYYLEPEENPYTSYQKGYVTVDAALRFGPRSRLWEAAFIGKNLTNRYYAMDGIDDGSSPAPGVPGDTQVYLVRPRQLELEFTVRPF